MCCSEVDPTLGSSVLSVWMSHSFSDRLLVEGVLGCFQFGAIMNNTAINICVLVLVWIFVFISFGLINVISALHGRCVFQFYKILANCFVFSLTRWETASCCSLLLLLGIVNLLFCFCF